MYKKTYTALLAFLFVFHACKKEPIKEPISNPTYKIVQFHIIGSQKYSADIEAKIYLKITATTPWNPDATVWDTILPKQPIQNLFKMGDTLTITNKLPVTATENTKFSGVHETTYYNHDQFVWYSGVGETLMRGDDTSKVLINL